MIDKKNRPGGKERVKDATLLLRRMTLPLTILSFLIMALLANREVAAEIHPVEENQITLESILRVAPTGVGLVKNRTIFHVNDYILNLTGYSRKELIGKSARIFYPTREEFDRVGKVKYAQIAARGTGSVETRWRRKDGAIRYVILSSMPLVPGRIEAGVTFTVLDITDRKIAEARLQESEERFSSLFHNHAVVMLLIDPATGAIVDANHAATVFYGWSREELLAMNINQINTLTPEAIKQEMQEAEIQARTYFEFSHRRADGSIRDVAVFSSGLLIEGRTLLFSVIHDITEQKQTEAALAARTQWFMVGLAALVALLLVMLIWQILGRRQRHLMTLALQESEKKYRELFEKAPVGIFESTPEGRYLTVNPAYAKTVGYNSPEEMLAGIGSAVDLYARPEDRERLLDELRRQGCVRNYEIEFRRRDGGHIWVATNTDARHQPDGGTLYNGYVFDITERKQAEQEVKESEERYRLLFEAANDAIVLLTNGRIVDCNEQALGIFRCSKDDLIGKMPWNISPEHQADGSNSRESNEKIRAMIAEKNLFFEWRFMRHDGTSFDADVSLTRIYKSQRLLVQAVIRDLSERREVEAEKEKLRNQLIQAQKMESVGRLAGGVAHDFNNMLGVIIGYTELALMRLEPGDKLYNHLNEIQKASRRSADLTRQLLAFARRQVVTPKELCLNETVAGMLKMIGRVIGEDIDLDWRPGEALWLVKIDPSQVDQVMANLCVNARDAIDGVGKVIIETGNVTFDEAYCTHHAGVVPGDYVLLAVSDNGCGMDTETVSHIFEPFFTTKERGKGTGLGLATVYGIVKQNEGFINVYSEPGRGTTFKVYLPRYLAEAVQPPAKEFAPEMVSGRETILLVEDEPMLLAMAKAMLEMQGYAVLASNSPEAALRMAEEHSGRIDLLLTDVVMPGMNGRELAARMVAVHPDLKLLFMSGYTANVIAHHGVLDEGVHFIQKPFSQTALAAKVREALTC